MIRLPPEQEDRIIAVYREGHSRYETARIVGCSPDTVTAVFRRRQLPMRSRGGPRFRLSHEEYDAVKALYDVGYSESEIGTILGKSRGCISWRLRYAGFPRRDPVEAKLVQRGFRPDPEIVLRPYESVKVVERPSPPRPPGPQPNREGGEGQVSRSATADRGAPGSDRPAPCPA